MDALDRIVGEFSELVREKGIDVERSVEEYLAAGEARYWAAKDAAEGAALGGVIEGRELAARVPVLMRRWEMANPADGRYSHNEMVARLAAASSLFAEHEPNKDLVSALDPVAVEPDLNTGVRQVLWATLADPKPDGDELDVLEIALKRVKGGLKA